MALNDYVSVSISATGPGPSAPGFGIGMLAAYHTVGGAARVLGPYTGIAGVAADLSNVSIGGSANYASSAPYLAAAVYFEQSPQPSLLYLGRRANAFTQVVTITPESAVTGTVYTFQIGCTGGVGGQTITYTVPGSSTIATVCTAITALLNTATTGPGPVYGFVAVDTGGTHIVCTATTAGTLTEFQCQVPASICRIGETTADPGLSADLTAIWAANKAWYGLGLDSASLAEGEVAATWTEANGSTICVLSSSDSDVADSTVTTDLFSHLKSTSVTRTAGLFTQYSNMSYGAFGWLAVHLTQPPGSDTWDSNTIAGVQADTDYLCPEASVLAVQAKNGSVYTTLANLNLTQGGTSGGGEWMDQTRFVDWLRVTIQLAFIALKARNQGKIPYDDFGIHLCVVALNSCLQQGVAAGGLVAGSIVITPPPVSSIPVASVQARVLPSLPWTAQLAGAIHRFVITGVASVA